MTAEDQLARHAHDSDQRHAAVSRELERVDRRLSEIHDLSLERVKEARDEREERKRTDSRLFAELRALAGQVTKLAEQVSSLKLAAEVEEKTDAAIELASTKRRDAIKGWLAIVAALFATGSAAWGLVKLVGKIIAEHGKP